MNALQQCQWRHDNAEPESAPAAWIETSAGKEWLEDSIKTLVLGSDVTVSFSPKVVVKALDFIIEFGQQAADIYANDESYHLDWTLARGHGAFGTRYSDLARQVAGKMLRPHADAAEAAAKWRDF